VGRYQYSFPPWTSIPTSFRSWRARRLLLPHGRRWLPGKGGPMSEPEPAVYVPQRHTSTFRDGSNYHFPVSDRYTPTSSQAPPLIENVANPDVWGHTPYDYVRWFDTIWHTGDPSGWGPEVFTRDAVMIDSTGITHGGDRAASDFLLLFQYFPDLRGEVVSWSHNNTEIFINWRFVVRSNLHIPVIDKFSFVDGLVSFREAYFDITMLLSYLTENFGSGPMYDFFMDRYWRSETTGGLFFVPGLVWAIIKGLFRWVPVPLDAPTGLTPVAGNGRVSLQWDPVPGAISYKVKRATDIAGPYKWLNAAVTDTSYVDTTVINGTKYFYTVCANTTKPPLSA